MKTFKEFSEQLVSGRVQPSTPAQTLSQRRLSSQRSSSVTKQMNQRARQELSSHREITKAILSSR